MVRPEADWKKQPWHAVDLVMLGLGTVLLLSFAALWWRAGSAVYLGLAVVFAVWAVLFLSDYWQPVLYLLFALILVISLTVIVYDGFWDGLYEGVVLGGALGFVVLCIALFVSEEMTAKEEAERRT